MSGRLADPIVDEAVAASNALTVQWARTHADSRSIVIAGAGVWPLLALLAASADGEARKELETAVGLPAAHATTGAASILATLRGAPGIAAALGIWIRRTISVLDQWRTRLPPSTLGELAGDDLDQDRLNKWAAGNTDGMISEMPIDIKPETLVVLASTLMVRTRWLQPFKTDDFPAFTKGHGPWSRRRDFTTLSRTGAELDDVFIATIPSIGSLSVVELRGQSEISVFLAMADRVVTPGQAMAEAVAAALGQHPCRYGSALVEGETAPGLSVAAVQTTAPSPAIIRVITVPFRIEAEHNLLDNVALFGLQAATDRSRNSFPQVSTVPLVVDQASQRVLAAFSAEGFEAAAVTAFGVSLSAHLPSSGRYRHLEIEVSFGRPFAFVAVHKPTRLVLVAGWVAEPQPVANPEVL